mmetsp:Transcript_39828/g.65224  ORF Transcript_39828/g.65224 Transcript_39828/m.65224 type:complete len:248 (+) Transcript_39828:1043-1786(+)
MIDSAMRHHTTLTRRMTLTATVTVRMRRRRRRMLLLLLLVICAATVALVVLMLMQMLMWSVVFALPATATAGLGGIPLKVGSIVVRPRRLNRCLAQNDVWIIECLECLIVRRKLYIGAVRVAMHLDVLNVAKLLKVRRQSTHRVQVRRNIVHVQLSFLVLRSLKFFTCAPIFFVAATATNIVSTVHFGKVALGANHAVVVVVGHHIADMLLSRTIEPIVLIKWIAVRRQSHLIQTLLRQGHARRRRL